MRIILTKNNKAIGNYTTVSTARHALKTKGYSDLQIDRLFIGLNKKEINTIEIKWKKTRK